MSPLDPSNPVLPGRGTRPAGDPGAYHNGTPPAPSGEAAAPSSYVPPALAAGATFGALCRALGRRWLLAVLLVALGGALAVLGLLAVIPAPYVSEMRMIVRRPPGYMPDGPDNGVTYDDYMRTQALALKNPRLLGAVLEHPSVRNLATVLEAGDDPTWLLENLTIKFSPGDNYIPIKLAGDNARDVPVILNVLSETYQQDLRRQRQAVVNLSQRSLDDVNEKLAVVLRDLPPFDPRQAEQVRTDLIAVRKELGRLRDDHEQLTNGKEPARGPDSRVVSVAVNEAMRGDEEAVEQERELRRVNRIIDEITRVATMGAGDPSLRDYYKERDRYERRLAVIRERYKGQVERQLSEQGREVREATIKALAERVRDKEREEKFLAGELTRLESFKTDKYTALDAQRKVLETARANLLGTIQRIEQDGDELRWVTPTKPTEPRSKDREKQVRFVALGTAGVVGLLLFGVAWVEFRNKRVNAATDVSQGLGIPTVGSLPYLPARARRVPPGSAAQRDPYWQGRLTEAVDSLRTFLLRAMGEGPHLVMVTSAGEGEGKTSLAGQLAASLARAWRKTLLIDGDLRKPQVHQLFDQPVEPGLSELLRGEMEQGDVIRPTAVSRLWVMPAGQWDPHALQALAQEGTSHIFDLLKEEFDFIVMDSSPVLPVTDPLLLGQHADTVILSVLCGKSRLPAVFATRQKLASLDIPVLGAVVAGGPNGLGGLDAAYPRRASASS